MHGLVRIRNSTMVMLWIKCARNERGARLGTRGIFGSEQLPWNLGKKAQVFHRKIKCRV